MRTVLAKCLVKVLAAKPAKPSSTYMTHMKKRGNKFLQIYVYNIHTHPKMGFLLAYLR